MNKANLELEIRLAAIEDVLCNIGQFVFALAKFNPEMMKQYRKSGREQMLKTTFPGVDPAMADHVSAELANQVERLLIEIENKVTDTFRKYQEAKKTSDRSLRSRRRRSGKETPERRTSP